MKATGNINGASLGLTTLFDLDASYLELRSKQLIT